MCLHICITPKNIDSCDELLSSLRILLHCKVEKDKKDITAIYGMAAKIPDKSIINEIVEYYLDFTTKC